MKILIVEDEQHSADLIKGLLLDHFPGIEIVGRTGNVREAVSLIENHRPDLLILDIEIHGGTGFDILDAIDPGSTRVIFCTGYDTYAIRAFKYNALDYILKPISVYELKDAVTKAEKIINQDLAFKTLKETGLGEPLNLVISERNKYVKLPLKDIVKAKAEGAYTRFVMNDGNVFVTSRSLGYYEEILPTEQFARIHHSFIVNLTHIRDFDFALGQITLINDKILDVSVRKRKMLRDLLNQKKDEK